MTEFITALKPGTRVKLTRTVPKNSKIYPEGHEGKIVEVITSYATFPPYYYNVLLDAEDDLPSVVMRAHPSTVQIAGDVQKSAVSKPVVSSQLSDLKEELLSLLDANFTQNYGENVADTMLQFYKRDYVPLQMVQLLFLAHFAHYYEFEDDKAVSDTLTSYTDKVLARLKSSSAFSRYAGALA